MLARPAAVKLIRPEALGAGNGEAAQLAMRRFTREAEAAANLRSPHTVEVYDFGVTEDQTLYFVMEMLDGMDLETLVRQHGALPPGRVIHIVRQVCESLEEAHARGLVHRDIKPANIHVGRVGLRYDFVKVLDFGLVKEVKRPSGEDTLVTAKGLALGTPSYMAPELALGEEVDGRADIYALGCVAYFLLTGHMVFEADNPMRLLVRHVEEKPVAPSTRTDQPVPRSLDEAILGCLAKDPAARTPSASALVDALTDGGGRRRAVGAGAGEAVVDGIGVRVRGQSPGSESRVRVRTLTPDSDPNSTIDGKPARHAIRRDVLHLTGRIVRERAHVVHQLVHDLIGKNDAVEDRIAPRQDVGGVRHERAVKQRLERPRVELQQLRVRFAVVLDERAESEYRPGVTERACELDVSERRRAEPIPVSIVTGHVHSTEVVQATQPVALPGADLRNGDVMELLVGKRRAVVALHTSQRQERLRALELLRGQCLVVARKESIPRRVREGQLIDEKRADRV